MAEPAYIQFFDGGESASHDLLGGKCASLVALTEAGLPVPPGFAVTTVAYDAFIHEAGIADDIHRMLGHVDADDTASIDRVSEQIRSEIISRPVPVVIHDAFTVAYESLQARFESPAPVAVR
ncbi:MAG: PEP/pyruvate-binding domain-containing protein [Microcella sp.]|nr:PEP/pyruvate-binding domain-containing protein [Microcella sp.]